jgi:electron transport complex protein RnfB
VAAIVGTAEHMHTVLPDACTGCELCLPPCPVDCIEMRPGPAPAPDQPLRNRGRFDAHTRRLSNRHLERQRQLDAKKAAALKAGMES